MRTSIRKCHFFLALLFGFPLVLVGITGSVLVYFTAIDTYLNPGLLTFQRANTSRLSYDATLEIAEKHLREQPVYVASLAAPLRPDSTQQVWYQNSNDPEALPFELYIHPSTGKVLGSRQWGSYFVSFVYHLHMSLLMGKTGHTIMGVAGIGACFLLFSGLCLWWPRGGRKKWRIALLPKQAASNTRRMTDAHRLTGFYSAFVLLTLCITGAAMQFPQESRALIGMIAPVSKKLLFQKQPAKTGQRISVDKAIQIGKAFHPACHFHRIYFQENILLPWRLTFVCPEDPMKTGGYNRVWIDPVKSRIIHRQDWGKAPAGDAILQWVFPLHNGEAFGLTGRGIIFISGLLPLIMLATGLWWRQRKRKH